VSPDEQGSFHADTFTQEWSDANFETFCYHIDKDQKEYQAAGWDIGLENTYPREKVVAVWQWNNQRAGMVDDTAEFGIEVPRVLFLKRGGVIGTAVIWEDARPALLPRVDSLILVADQLRRGAHSDEEREIAMLDWSEFECVLIGNRGGASIPDSPLNAVSVTDDERSPEIEELFRTAPLLSRNALTTIDPSEVFEGEIVEEARRAVAAGGEDAGWKNMRIIIGEDRRS